jgi:hypothetical protein
VQGGHVIGSFIAGLFSALKPLAIWDAQAIGREALNTGAQIITDIRTKQPQTTVKDVVSERLTESAQRLVTKLKGGSRKRKSETSNTPRQKKKPPK